MSSNFVPESPPLSTNQDVENLAEYLGRQFLSLQQDLNARHDWQDAEPFDGKARDRMLRWFDNGAPGNDKGAGFYYYWNGQWTFIGGTEVLVYGEAIPGTGDVWTDVNAHDFSGNEYAGQDGCTSTALPIKSNAIVLFGHNGISYIWVGDSGVCLGVGGTYASVEDDYAPLGTGDHSVLSNRDAADQHPQTAIGGRGGAADLQADQAQQDQNLSDHQSASPAHTMTQIDGLNADQNRQDTNHSNHTGDLNNPHQVQHAQLPDVDPNPADPHSQYQLKYPGMFLGGTTNNFTLNTTDSKLVNYSESAEWNWTDDDDINPSAGEITIPDDGVYQFTVHVLGDQGNDNKEEWIELKVDVAGGSSPGRFRVDVLEVATDKTTGRCVQATWTRPAYTGEVYSVWMWASTGLGTFNVEATTFEAAKIADISELR